MDKSLQPEHTGLSARTSALSRPINVSLGHIRLHQIHIH
jgi:hypothetical protein